MTDYRTLLSAFPDASGYVAAKWAPVILEPITGSYERLVVGVAAVSANDFHLEIANRLDRLNCFYGSEAVGPIEAVDLAVHWLREDLSRRSGAALLDPKPLVTGVVVGECRSGEGPSLRAICQSWLAALSSLYQLEAEAFALETEVIVAGGGQSKQPDRLSVLVYEHLRTHGNPAIRYFNPDVREGGARKRGRSHDIVIDYSGPKLVANFSTLKANYLGGSVKVIKQRLWDLKVERDRDPEVSVSRTHEMIVQRPADDDPQLSRKQKVKMADASEALEEQAGKVELRLRALTSVEEIGNHILEVEAA